MQKIKISLVVLFMLAFNVGTNLLTYKFAKSQEKQCAQQIVEINKVEKQFIKKKIFRKDGTLKSETDQSIDSFFAARSRKQTPPDNLIFEASASLGYFKDLQFKSVEILYRPIDNLPVYLGGGYDKKYNEAILKAAVSTRTEFFK